MPPRTGGRPTRLDTARRGSAKRHQQQAAPASSCQSCPPAPRDCRRAPTRSLLAPALAAPPSCSNARRWADTGARLAGAHGSGQRPLAKLGLQTRCSHPDLHPPPCATMQGKHTGLPCGHPLCCRPPAGKRTQQTRSGRKRCRRGRARRRAGWAPWAPAGCRSAASRARAGTRGRSCRRRPRHSRRGARRRRAAAPCPASGPAAGGRRSGDRLQAEGRRQGLRERGSSVVAPAGGRPSAHHRRPGHPVLLLR